MRHLTLFFCAAVVAGCSKSEDRAAQTTVDRDSAVTVGATPGTATTISLADVAGKWKVRTTDESGGTAVETELHATADTAGWTLTAPNRKPIPVRVSAVSGDSIVTESGPYESFVRKGLQVRTRTVNRLQNGKLVGTVEARYAISGRDSVARRPMEGTRLP